MRALSILLVALTLAACGADGEPTAPGLTVSGEARMGVILN